MDNYGFSGQNYETKNHLKQGEMVQRKLGKTEKKISENRVKTGGKLGNIIIGG